MDYLLKQEVFFQNLFHTIPLIILIVNSQGRIVEINDAAKKFISENGGITQYNNKFGGYVFRCIHRFDNEQGCTFGPYCRECDLRMNTIEALKGNSIVRVSGKLTIESKIKPKTMNLLISTSPVYLSDEKYAIVVIEDITEKKALEEEMFKTQKLESVGILAGGIAHDFNNILAAILSNIQLAMIQLEQNKEIRKYLANTVEITRKASELTKQLLTFSKGGAPVRKNASLVELIKDTAEFALRGAKTRVKFIIPDNLWLVSIDESQISQVINNLVINAQQAMPKGGVILITANNIMLETESRFKPGNYVKIAVQDQGIGIPKENLDKIFDPFFTTKKEGNGLGLATSYSIIQHHDGYIDVESCEGVGSTFIIYLPAMNGVLAPIQSQKEVVASGEGFKILLMDDELHILNAVGEMLRHHGYRVILVQDGNSAIERYKEAKEAGEPFDAVILDLTIPGGKGGQEVISDLRDIDPKVKAVISSGYANDPVIANYERFGFLGVVNKPYKIDELYEVLQKVLKPE